jgi:hypothetical protein
MECAMNALLATSVVQALYAFALMAVIAFLCAGVIKLIVMILARSTRAAQAVAIPRPVASPSAAAAAPATAVAAATETDEAEISDDIAIIIAAACHAAIGAHRIVYVAESRRAANWTTEMRSRHHLSHVPHR